jgi:hypothetical protein
VSYVRLAARARPLSVIRAGSSSHISGRSNRHRSLIGNRTNVVFELHKAHGSAANAYNPSAHQVALPGEGKLRPADRPVANRHSTAMAQHKRSSAASAVVLISMFVLSAEARFLGERSTRADWAQHSFAGALGPMQLSHKLVLLQVLRGHCCRPPQAPAHPLVSVLAANLVQLQGSTAGSVGPELLHLTFLFPCMPCSCWWCRACCSYWCQWRKRG